MNIADFKLRQQRFPGPMPMAGDGVWHITPADSRRALCPDVTADFGDEALPPGWEDQPDVCEDCKLILRNYS